MEPNYEEAFGAPDSHHEVPYCWVLIIRIPLFRVLFFLGSPISETPKTRLINTYLALLELLKNRYRALIP